MRTIVLLSLSLLLLLPNFIRKDINEQVPYDGKERYRPELASIQTVSELEQYTDRCAASKNFELHSLEYTAMLAYVVSCRFYHGFSHYSLSENWIAALGEKIVGYGLASKVDPEAILQHANAACSQQALVMMAVLRNKGIPYRKVGFPHHYALEVNIHNRWYYFDPNMEPRMNLQQRLHENWSGYNDNLKSYYNPAIHQHLDFQFGQGQVAEVGPINEIPGSNVSRFHGFTRLLSKTLWLLPFSFLFVRRRRPVLYPVKPVNHHPIYRLRWQRPYYA
jgi:hypothetical protein